MSFENATQKIVFDILTNHAPLMAEVSGVYDFVPQDKQFPYVTIGESFHSANNSSVVFSDDVAVLINVWARGTNSSPSKGRRQAKQVQSLVYDALQYGENKANDPNYAVIAINWVDSTTLTDSDGLTTHGIQNFRMYLQKR